MDYWQSLIVKNMNKASSNLAKWQIDDAYRLRKLIDAHNIKHELTQTSFMQKCGFTQGMYAQLCGSETKPPRRPLSYEQVTKLAKTMGVLIEDISPTLARDILDMCSHIRLTTAKRASK